MNQEAKEFFDWVDQKMEKMNQVESKKSNKKKQVIKSFDELADLIKEKSNEQGKD